MSDFSRHLENLTSISLLKGYGVHTSFAATISLLINLTLRFYPASE
ncbi:hypothetical protein [Nostoc sp. UHCC 0252]|nr:hypothetical protein [Nostoc sp. UHCC 0252]MEA5603065.1 hypothetical protein [Nostoc sp. UHCC 0252]